MTSAYLLVSHGSRDPRPAIAMQQIAGLMAEKLHLPEKLVGTGYLEVVSEPLHEQIRNFAQITVACGCHHLKIIPLFLFPGVHVMTDIPSEVTQAQQAVGKDMLIELQPYLGSHPGLPIFLQKQIATIKAQAWILLSHGSRRPGSQKPVETMATYIGGVAAYWSVAPSLESRVQELIAIGYKEIAILPYFLFSGGITDAIAQAVEALKLQFPGVSLYLAEPLGVSGELADLIGDLIYT
ncbi:Cobalamin (vitamin B12) biosynthesis CbiX protein [Trichormus variabilis ATCC 29413]|uniref:Cobalamin (Vitamin B12) biosynthesis CbiX protein n=2 Tax=Anabaena variabilis TaxID=264691 RepID=Q3M904_TRIV2|nr:MULTISPECIES: sirohydrochlorin chelatase [Nostocaceae]ABA22532.1 Cobalamin (vitamin B12) biosynthesis CbiX protein [Trichormus variabilis ATCC 29413]MBC1212997.1 sirohydrochlorin chelatase [Trichormus variabilis ARAD]MBC1258144.1 sirohydrochlorin chelatase [Trichormus variabilis V5]MBC1268141.1 sirohydrochlorin chelatase [Trichormus variabilis FSR]MBC1300983.1 sirohydrochlorin chelatase [Trichormus variabilis N2B]